MRYYLLTLIFTCGQDCGEPPKVTLPTHYATAMECVQAGDQWITVHANPQKAIRTFTCGWKED